MLYFLPYSDLVLLYPFQQYFSHNKIVEAEFQIREGIEDNSKIIFLIS